MRRFKADTLMTDGQPVKAAREIDARLKTDRTNPATLNHLALAYQRANDPRAQKPPDAAVRLALENPVILDTPGWILVDSGDAAQSMAVLRQATARAPAARDIS